MFGLPYTQTDCATGTARATYMAWAECPIDYTWWPSKQELSERQKMLLERAFILPDSKRRRLQVWRPNL